MNDTREHAVLRYAVCGRTVEVLVDDARLCEPLQRLFPAYHVDSGTAICPSAALAVRSADGAYVVEGPSGARTRCDSQIDLLAACEFALTEAFLAGCIHLVQLHAAGAVVSGHAVLALGRAGAGKSSLAVSWHHAGHAALGDDVVLVDADARAVPFKRLFEVDSGVLAAIGVDPAETCFWRPASREAWYDPARGAGWAEPAPVGLIALARYRCGAPLSVSAVSRAVALNALVYSRLPSVRDLSDSFDRLARVAAQARAYEVTFNSAVEAAEALAALVG